MAPACKFKPGDRVLLLLPNISCKFLARWQGPYTILVRVGPVNYHLQQPGKLNSMLLYHINLPKPWIELIPALTAIVTLTDYPHEQLHVGEELLPAQKQNLRKMEP